MTGTFRKLRLASIALAAIAGGLLLVAEGAGASCVQMPAAGACDAGCGCCQSSAPSGPVANPAELATYPEPIVSLVWQGSRGAPLRGCAGCARSPAAPGIKGNRTYESRHDPGRVLASGSFDFNRSLRALAAPDAMKGARADHSRLYLRTSRLLI